MDRRSLLKAATVLPFGAVTALIPRSSEAAWTDMGLQFNQLRPGQEAPVRDGPMRSNPVSFRVVANAAAIVIAAQNPYRKGLLIKNLDPTNNLYIGFGTLADLGGFALSPLQTVLFDFVCPTDTVSAFSTASIGGYMLEMAPISL